MLNKVRSIPLRDLSVHSRIMLGATYWEAPECIVYSNFSRLNRSFGMHHERGLWVRAVHTIPEVILGRLPQSTDLVVPSGEDFIPITQHAEALAEQVPPYFKSDDLEKVLSWEGPVIEIGHPSVIIGRFGIRTWGHWIGELLPKIIVVEESLPLRYKYILPAEIRSLSGFTTLLESLQYYGIGLDRLVLLSPGRYHFSELYAVSSVWSPTKIHPDAVALMRTSIKVPLQQIRRGKIALLRNESKTRNIENVKEVARILSENGFTPVDIGHLSFADQVQAFASAEVVAGVLGSGFSGLLYSPDNVKVLSFAPSSWGDLFFFSLMQLRNAKLVDIRGLPAKGDQRTSANAQFELKTSEVLGGLSILDAN